MESHRSCQPELAHTRQRSAGGTQASHPCKQLQSGVNASRLAPTKHSRTSNPNIQDHFISVLAGVADGFPINQWDKLLPETILTLNLVWQSNTAPNISAWAYHHGSFDYNRMLIVPMRCEVQFHIKPTRQKTFGEHSGDGFYLRTSAEHYRTHIVFVKKTRAQQLADTVFFKHNNTSRCHHQCIQQALASNTRYTAFQRRCTIGRIGKDRKTLQQTHNKTGNEAARVHSPRVNSDLPQETIRVRFNDRPPSTQESPPRLVVAWPQEQIVQHEVMSKKPKPILKPSTYIAKSSESIASRVKA
eukprot:CCRYP_002953-RA/>CCRYP_002953-RA protein AED:0.55 eAED:0.48 QI:0/0/0/1/0/0/2/0/300